MAPSQSNNNTLRVPKSSFYSHSNSTSKLDPPTFSPRSCTDSPIRPFSSSGYRTVAGRPRRKNMREMIGTTTEEEFDALPIAVRRKYFSTLERLRFAQNSGSSAINDPVVTCRGRLPLADRRELRHNLSLNPPQEPSTTSSPRTRLRNSRKSSVSSADVSWFLNLPDKIRKKQSMGEERGVIPGNRRESVILDAADEAIYKASRRASRKLTPMIVSPTAASSRGSMDSARTGNEASRPSSVTKAMFESFRWMDEEEDLDLRLVLDDYHANLDGVVLPTPASTQRPSFRRHMSISKIPFGRSSFSSMNPSLPTKPALKSSHTRQKSRTMSLIQPKHSISESISSIDPAATHYQDPEARLKLRVYLASPQKFDEAIEFGFPSIDGVSTIADKENKRRRKVSREKNLPRSPLADKTQTFFDDDNISLSDDDTSMLDPESPLTPSEPCATFKPQPSLRPPFSPKSSRPSDDFSHLGIKKPSLHKHAESYAQSITGSREMTLRMTLTRPDLRADESLIYGWQGVRNRSPLGDDVLGGAEGSPSPRNEMRGPLGGVDGWGPVEKDDGVVKRFWNRVRSVQRKSS